MSESKTTKSLKWALNQPGNSTTLHGIASRLNSQQFSGNATKIPSFKYGSFRLSSRIGHNESTNDLVNKELADTKNIFAHLEPELSQAGLQDSTMQAEAQAIRDKFEAQLEALKEQEQAEIARKAEELAEAMFQQKLAAIHELDVEYGEFKAKNAALNSEFCKLTRDLADLKSGSKRRNVQAEVNVAKKELVTIKRNIETAQKALNATKAKSHANTITLSVLNQEIKAGQTRKQDTQILLNKAIKELETTNQKVDAVNKVLKEVKTQRTKDNNTQLTLKREIESFKALKQNAKVQIITSNKQLVLINREIDAAQKDLRVIEGHRNIAEKTLYNMDRQIKTFQVRKLEVQSQVNVANEKLTTTNQKVSAAQKELKSDETQRSNNKTHFSDLKSKIKSYQARRLVNPAEVEGAKKELAQINQQIDAAKIERDTILHHHTDVYLSLNQELKSFETFKQETEAKVGVAKEELASTKVKLAVVQRELDDVETHIGIGLNTLSELNEEVSFLSQENATLNQKAAVVNQEVGPCQNPKESTQCVNKKLLMVSRGVDAIQTTPSKTSCDCNHTECSQALTPENVKIYKTFEDAQTTMERAEQKLSLTQQQFDASQKKLENIKSQLNDTHSVFQKEVEHFQSLKQKTEYEAEVAKEELGVTSQKIDVAKRALADIEDQLNKKNASLAVFRHELMSFQHCHLEAQEEGKEFSRFSMSQRLLAQRELDDALQELLKVQKEKDLAISSFDQTRKDVRNLRNHKSKVSVKDLLCQTSMSNSTSLQKNSSSNNLADFTPKSAIKDEEKKSFLPGKVEETQSLTPVEMTGNANSSKVPSQSTIKTDIPLLKEKLQTTLDAIRVGVTERKSKDKFK